MEYLNVEAYERDAVTCLDGATCEGETWARAPCVAGTRETVAPCAGTGAQCSVESGRACSWFVVVPGPAAAADQAEVPASSAGRALDWGGRETSRGCSEPARASSAVPPGPRVPPGADWGGPGTSRDSAGSSRASSAGLDLQAPPDADLDGRETFRGCSESFQASAGREASHAAQEPSQVPWVSDRAPSRAFLLPSAF